MKRYILTASKCCKALEVLMREELVGELRICGVLADFARFHPPTAMRNAAGNRGELVLCTPVVQLRVGEADARLAFLEQGCCTICDDLPPCFVAGRAAENRDDAAVRVEEGDGEAEKK